ncbi:hypothetical protein [Natronincola ferrireducens]|nr:hypothetical protein [Natronincola ferrireducens]
MFNLIINIAFLTILLVPIVILFLTFIKITGEDIRKSLSIKKENAFYSPKEKRQAMEGLRRIK